MIVTFCVATEQNYCFLYFDGHLVVPGLSDADTVATMATLDTAKGIYETEAQRFEGRRAGELADALKERAERLKEMREETADGARTVIVGDAAQHAVAASKDFPDVLPAEAEDVAALLDEAGRDIGETVGKTNARNEKLGEGIAGQAQLSSSGSDTFDAGALEGEGKVVDKEWAAGVAAHEQFHTQQHEPDTENVTLANGQEITAHEFIEAGAIAAQEKAAPRSVQRLSAEYQAIRRKLASVLPPDQLLERSKKGALKDLEAPTLAA